MNSSIATEIQHNLKMLNDIARNLGAGRSDDKAGQLVAAHVKRFWSPMMIESLCSEYDSIEAELLPPARVALRELQN